MGNTATKTRTVRVVVDLLVEDDIWEEQLRAGCTDKYLVGEVKKSFRLTTGRLWRDAEITDIKLIEEGGDHAQE